MYWIALWPSADDERTAWGWWALRFTPRVAWVDEALLLEVSGSLRLFGGRRLLLQQVLQAHPGLGLGEWSSGATSLLALARLRCKRLGDPLPRTADALPLQVLSAAREHLATLERIGCTTWGQLRALPRPGVARRFGAALLAALDAAYARQPESHPWLTLPEVFDLNAELATLATGTPELMDAAQRLLTHLQLWLQARNRGVLALELEWTLDLRRLNGVHLPRQEQLVVRTAQPTQQMAHLRRLVGEHLARASLSAPANHLRLRTLETVPWAGACTSLLPEDNVQGERMHQLVERLSARLGEHNVVVPQPQADYRPEHKQQWRPAREPAAAAQPGDADALYPTWLLPQPLRLSMQGEQPCYGGPLRRLARLYRVETAWWDEGGSALRDYFIARSPQAGLVWIYRERPRQLAADERARFTWYLQGLYA